MWDKEWQNMNTYTVNRKIDTELNKLVFQLFLQSDKTFKSC